MVAGSGLDCSSFISKAWGISRHTTDNLSSVATRREPEGFGHVRMFDCWANAEHTKMYVYEETTPKSIHRVISWNPYYQPMRRTNVTDA